MPAMKTRLRTHTLAYDERGTGRPLLFVHGYPLSRAMWAPQWSGLSDAARVLAIDLRGHGESDVLPGPYAMDQLADDCAGLLDALGIREPIVLGGLSMGGYVAFAFWRRYPERVAGLILAATRAGADSPEARAGRETAMATAQSAGVDAVVDSMLPRLLAPGAVEAQPELVARMRGIMAATPLTGMLGDLAGLRDRVDSTATLATITVPTLVVHGAKDQLIPLAEAERTASLIAGATLAVIDEAGHLPNLEQPERFNAAVLDYLARLSSDPHVHA
jgi:3-oxoadipate enol-lactonase